MEIIHHLTILFLLWALYIGAAYAYVLPVVLLLSIPLAAIFRQAYSVIQLLGIIVLFSLGNFILIGGAVAHYALTWDAQQQSMAGSEFSTFNYVPGLHLASLIPAAIVYGVLLLFLRKQKQIQPQATNLTVRHRHHASDERPS